MRQYSEWSASYNLVLTESTELAVVLKNVKNTAHLGEDENTRPLGLHALEELVEDDHFTSILDQVLVGRVRGTGLGTVKH